MPRAGRHVACATARHCRARPGPRGIPVYDLYDSSGQLVQASDSTNTATAYVQVGQMYSVETGSMLQLDDKYVLK
jgi:hypothetical protein